MDNHYIFTACNTGNRKIIEFSRMQNGFFYDAHPFTKLMLVLFLMVTSYLVMFGLGLLAAITVFDVSAAKVITLLENSEFGENIPMIKMMQVLYSTGLFLLPALLAAFLIGGSTGRYLSAVRLPRAELFLLVILLMFTIVPLVNYIGFLSEKLALPEQWGITDRIRENDEDQWRLMESFLYTGGIAGLVFNVFIIAVIPAIGEEFLFRGILQRILGEWFRNRHAAIWIVALLFSLAHYQYSAFIPRILLGALFGYIFVWTSSIWMPVIAHFINNSLGVVYYHFYYRGNIETDPDRIGLDHNILVYLLVSLVISILIAVLIRRLGKGSTDAQLPGFE